MPGDALDRPDDDCGRRRVAPSIRTIRSGAPPPAHPVQRFNQDPSP